MFKVPARNPTTLRDSAALVVTVAWLIFVIYALNREYSSSLLQQPAMTGSGAHPDGLVFVTSHEAGTALVQRITDTIIKHMDTFCQHKLTHMHIDDDLDGPTLGYSLDVAKIMAGEKTEAAQAPYLMLTTDNIPVETCWDTADMPEDAEQIQHIADHSSSPKAICPKECPCKKGVTNCLEMGSCYSAEPHANLFWVQVIHNPLDVVIASYAAQMADPPKDAWLQTVPVQRYSKFLAEVGVSNESMTSLGIWAPGHAGTSYWQFLRGLPQQDGILLEFLRISADLWRAARLYHRLSKFNHATVIRYEDMVIDPLGALTPLMTQLATPCFAKHVRAFTDQIIKTCLIGSSWDPTGLATFSNHVGQHASRETEKWGRELMSNPHAYESMVRLQAAFGYVAAEGATNSTCDFCDTFKKEKVLTADVVAADDVTTDFVATAA